MVKRFFEVRKDENGDFYFTDARGQVVTVGGLSFGLTFNGRGLTATELTTGAAVATIDNAAVDAYNALTTFDGFEHIRRI